MNVTALLMAGGRGTRLKVGKEKPLLEVNSKPLVQYVLDSLRAAKKVDRIIVAVSDYTPKTAEYARRHSLEVLQTPGDGFCLDIGYAIRTLKLGAVLVISSDLPLITGEIIDRVITYFEGCRKHSLTVAAPLELYKKLGISVDYFFTVEGRDIVPVGLNMIDGKKITEKRTAVDEEVLVVDDIRIVANLNTLEDLQIIENLLRKQ